MRTKWIVFASLILGAISVASCVDPDQTQEVILKRDKEAIEKFISENALPNAKEYSEPVEGFYVFWEVSTDPEVNVLLVSDTVRVNYIGKLLNNQVFDSSIEQVAKDNGVFNTGRNYQPLKFPLGRGIVIPGFELALSLMRAGEKAIVIFPSRLGYGNQPQGPVPPNSPLIFELDLLDVKLGPNHL